MSRPNHTLTGRLWVTDRRILSHAKQHRRAPPEGPTCARYSSRRLGQEIARGCREGRLCARGGAGIGHLPAGGDYSLRVVCPLSG